MVKLQKSGEKSTNIQTENLTINKGISYADARDIALEVFQSNFIKLSEQAAVIAKSRAEDITEQFFNKLLEQNPKGIENSKDPDFQHSLFTVQKEYAKSGDKNLGDLLVDLLVDRTKHDKRTILQIVLNESLSVAPKLTDDQLAALSVIFLIKHTINNGINNIETFLNYLDIYLKPFSQLLSKNSSCYQHLSFAGCGTISIGGNDIIDIIMQRYKGIFSKGFTIEDINNANVKLEDYPSLFIPCLHDKTKYQINAISDEDLRTKLDKYNLIEQDSNIFINLNNSNLMGSEEVHSYIVQNREYMSNVFSVWKNSFMKNLTLTSVGIAIGHANIKRTIGEFTDLSIWIN